MGDRKLSDPIKKWIESALQDATSREKDLVRKMANSLARSPMIKKQVQNAIWEGLPLLHFAAEHGHELLFNLLLEEFHTDPNLVNEKNDTTVLHIFAKTGNTKLLKPLVKTLAGHIDAVDNGGSSPLCVSISFNHIDVTQMLLKNKASTQVTSYLGMPIHVATYGNYVDVVKLLRKKSPDDVNAECYGFCTPLVVAALSKSTECLMHLAKFANVNAKPLCYKLMCNSDSEEYSLKCINVLLKYGMDPNLFDQETLLEEPPIILAAKKGWNNVVEALLARTEQVPGLADWTVQGIINHVNSDVFQEMNRVERENRVEQLMERMTQDIQDGGFLPADLICKSLRPDMPEEQWDFFHSMCSIRIKFAAEGTFLELGADAMQSVVLVMSRVYGDIDAALLAAKATLALEPENEHYRNTYLEIRGAIESRAREAEEMAAKEAEERAAKEAEATGAREVDARTANRGRVARGRRRR